MCGVRSFGLVQLDNIMEGSLFDGVRLAGGTRLIALNIVTRDKDAVAGNNFTRFKESDVANYDLL
jgi:hypothetical protein